MKVTLFHKGKELPATLHNGQMYVVAPETGDYTIRLYNDSGVRKLAVLSVDGINVISGEDAGVEGNGYVLPPWQTYDIPGWRRDDSKVAAFQFSAAGEGYAAQTGRGTASTGVVGVAVFHEKVQVVNLGHVNHGGVLRGMGWRQDGPLDTFGTHLDSSTASTASVMNVKSIMEGGAVLDMANGGGEEKTSGTFSSFAPDLGTGYGHETSFHTTTTTFQRASTIPAEIITLQYATASRLRDWGVPLPGQAPPAPNPFPVASGPSVVPPPGWRG